MKIALVPRGTGSGHNMRLYAIAKELRTEDKSIDQIAFLESLKGTFSKLFQSIGVQVININQGSTDDYSKGSILKEKLDWNSVMNGFLGPTIFNSQKILLLIRTFIQNKIDLVISDLDISAIAAANFCGVKSILVSERYELPISKFTNENFKKAGFKVVENELNDIHKVIRKIFDWGLDNASKVVTDCPYVEELDKNLHFKELLSREHAVFVGPIIRKQDKQVDINKTRKNYDIAPDDFLIVAAVGGTTMFAEDKKKMQQSYIKVFKNLNKTNPHVKMILLARDNFKVPEGMICMQYLPDWYGLLKSSNLVLTHPGWITVAELSVLRVPAIFSISSKREYHEWDELIRLSALGYETNIGCNPITLTKKIKEVVKEPQKLTSLTEAYSKVAPWSNGAYWVAKIALNLSGER